MQPPTISPSRSSSPKPPESVKVLQECIELQLKKSADYQNPNSSVVQADYYPHGVNTIHDIMHGKMLRMRSVLDAMEVPGYKPNFESLEDSAKDLINYASFLVSYARGRIPGQNPFHDHLNRPMQEVLPDGPEITRDIPQGR